jgi:hypothetical protein
MRTVEDRSGKRYLLLKESGASSLVRDPETGERRYVDNDALVPVDGTSPLVAAAHVVPEDVRRLLTAVPDERTLGLLVELDARGPLSVRELLGADDRCESDLHGMLGELGAAGLVVERDVGGERGYAITDEAVAALETVTD